MTDETPGSPVLPVHDAELTEAVTHLSSEADLLLAVNTLSTNVDNLTRSLTLNRLYTKRMRIVFGCIIAIIFAVLFVGYNAITDNHDTQVQQCENANSVREANVVLWSTVLGFTASDADVNTQAAVAALLDWINTLYQPRDCGDLDREYISPPPPDLSQFFPEPVSGNST